MVLVNYADRKVNCKIVYYGAEESGKTSNLVYIYNQLDESTRSNLITLESTAERTLFFDFMSLDLGEVKGFSTTFSLYTVPGQIQYNDARKLILNGVDGLVFVADSDPSKRESNIESFQNMVDNLAAYGLDFDTIPLAIQYNKRDLENVLDLDKLEKDINKEGFPSFEAVATEGSGVFATLKAVSNLILTSLQ
ncbi:MAG: GTPase domain-containing protein [Cyanobacteriota bacterium]